MSKVKKPIPNHFAQALRPGDLIDIVAPGSSADFKLLEKASRIFESWGYKTRFQLDLLKPDMMYLSNTDQYRFQSLKKALLAKDSKAVWCLRGGYGALRLLPFLQKVKKPKQKKLFIGLSDITSIHLFLNQKWNWQTLHGPLVDRVAQEVLSEENCTELKAALDGSKNTFNFNNLMPLSDQALKVRTITGPVIGGNLMVATSSVGTPWQIKGAGKILFFEELNERAYRIDRCLQQMRQAGVFKKVKAVLFGDLVKCEEANGKDFVLPTLKNFFNELKVPAFYGVESGHADLQRPVFFNTKAKITTSAIDQTQPKVVIYSPYEILKPRK
ncbi:MAG: LD-carboxypeptidase [Pseudobdellovibrio sp.]